MRSNVWLVLTITQCPLPPPGKERVNGLPKSQAKPGDPAWGLEEVKVGARLGVVPGSWVGRGLQATVERGAA